LSSFYEVEKDEFDFDQFTESSEVEEWGILYMRKDKTGSCVSWVKDKGFLDYNKTRNPKPNDKDCETEIKSMIELIFEIEDDDWADEPESSKKGGKRVPAKKAGTAKEGAAEKPALRKKALPSGKEDGSAAGKKSPVAAKKKVVGGTKKKATDEE
jgi:hypothetical protein